MNTAKQPKHQHGMTNVILTQIEKAIEQLKQITIEQQKIISEQKATCFLVQK